MKRPKQTRRYRRRTVRVQVEYDACDGPQRAVATTLGAGGMFIATEEPLVEHTRLKLRFQLATRGRMHEVEGHVVWANHPGEGPPHSRGMGIAFDDPAARSALAKELEGLPAAPADEAPAGEGDAEGSRD